MHTTCIGPFIRINKFSCWAVVAAAVVVFVIAVAVG